MIREVRFAGMPFRPVLYCCVSVGIGIGKEGKAGGQPACASAQRRSGGRAPSPPECRRSPRATLRPAATAPFVRQGRPRSGRRRTASRTHGCLQAGCVEKNGGGVCVVVMEWGAGREPPMPGAPIPHGSRGRMNARLIAHWQPGVGNSWLCPATHARKTMRSPAWPRPRFLAGPSVPSCRNARPLAVWPRAPLRRGRAPAACSKGAPQPRVALLTPASSSSVLRFLGLPCLSSWQRSGSFRLSSSLTPICSTKAVPRVHWLQGKRRVADALRRGRRRA